jgi:hypothetical protein
MSTIDRRSELEAIADVLRRHLADTPSAYVAPISKQLAAVVKELDELPNGEAEVNPLAELRLVRESRPADSVPASGRRNQSRRRGRVQAS